MLTRLDPGKSPPDLSKKAALIRGGLFCVVASLVLCIGVYLVGFALGWLRAEEGPLDSCKGLLWMLCQKFFFLSGMADGLPESDGTLVATFIIHIVVYAALLFVPTYLLIRRKHRVKPGGEIS